LTTTSNGEGHAGRVPSSNTSNLAETSVGLAWQTGDAPASNDTLATVTASDTDGIDHLVGGEDGLHGDGLLKETISPVDLLGDGTAVDLNLEEVSLLLAEVELVDLSVSEDTDNLAVLLDALELAEEIGIAGLQLSAVASEALLLGAIPVLIEATLELVVQVLRPDGGQGAETTGSLDVADQTADHHGGSLNDRDTLDGLALVQLGAGLVHLSKNVSHASLVANERGQVGSLGRIVLGERAYATLVVLGALAGQETQRSATGVFKFTMGHLGSLMKSLMK